jgi:hypothetical protein
MGAPVDSSTRSRRVTTAWLRVIDDAVGVRSGATVVVVGSRTDAEPAG